MKYIIVDNYGRTLKKADKKVLFLNEGDYLILDDGNYNVTFKTINYPDKTVQINVELDE
jgi:hypothetical protein